MVKQENGKNEEVHTIPPKLAEKKMVETREKFWHIDREMLRFKLHFFLFVGGAGIGCIVAGFGFDNLGGHSTFFFLSVFSGCGTILSIILHLCIRRRKDSYDMTTFQNT
ncbi:unnamed protein product [Larinioides sclopetarius]|uniref:Uncharacterized protein n=1 Tax=Larinioides sclopetarius TaxID=280406 RepID=A0AAV2BX59_9ARAC